jgi:hypothetical protein
MPEVRREIHALGSPDHGLGLAGRFAHGVTAHYLGRPPEAPAFHIGYNTLPDPPYPLPSRVFHDIDTLDGWLGCGQDMSLFLRAGLESLRGRPLPELESFDDQTRLIYYLPRTDAMALVWRARMIQPTQSVAAWTLTADLLSGHAGPGALATGPSEKVLITVVVDRAGTALLAYGPTSGTADDIIVATASGSAMDEVAGPLRELLDAQYAWATAVFGKQPPPAKATVEQLMERLKAAGAATAR